LFDSVKLLIDNRVIFWGLPSIFIVYGVISAPQIKSKVGKLLGDASYSIYLIQVISIQAYYKFFSALNIQMNNDFLVIGCLIATAIGGVVMYLLVEKPMISFLKKRIVAV
jgi:exopolysaccharide production protein ExoZ